MASGVRKSATTRRPSISAAEMLRSLDVPYIAAHALEFQTIEQWEDSDRGRRLDHIWVGQGLKAAVTSQEIHRKIRGWQQPSDHVPVVATIET